MATFKQIADFDVARFMGDRSRLSKCADGFFRDLFVGHNNAFPDEVMHGAFDWDGEIIYAPCAYESAFNAWSSIGRFFKHVQSDPGDIDARQETYYVYHCANAAAGNIVFGDNRTVFCAAGHISTTTQKIFTAKGDRTFDAQHLSVATDGTVVFKSDQVLYILSCSDNAMTGYVTHTIPLGSGASWFKLLENKLDNDFSYVAVCETKKSAVTREESGKLWLIGLKTNGVINRLGIDGIQDCSRHPQKPELVVLGQKLTLLSLPDLKTIRSVALSLNGSTKNVHPACAAVTHSPNSRHFALAYAGNGDVEIRDARTLEMMHTLNGRGFPLPDMAWDSTGNYLACRFADQPGQTKTELAVFDIRSQEIVFKIAINNKITESFPGTFFKWSPHATELACLIDNQRIQVYKLA